MRFPDLIHSLLNPGARRSNPEGEPAAGSLPPCGVAMAGPVAKTGPAFLIQSNERQSCCDGRGRLILALDTDSPAPLMTAANAPLTRVDPPGRWGHSPPQPETPASACRAQRARGPGGLDLVFQQRRVPGGASTIASTTFSVWIRNPWCAVIRRSTAAIEYETTSLISRAAPRCLRAARRLAASRT